MPLFVEVALPVPMRQTFSYNVPESVTPVPRKGMRVKVPFGRQQLIGLVIRTSDTCNLAPHQIKSILELLDDEPLLPEPLYKLTAWAARYYFCSLGQMLSQALPVALRKGAAVCADTTTFWSVTAAGNAASLDTLTRAPAQQKVMQALLAAEMTQEEVTSLALSKPAIKALHDKGWIAKDERTNQIDLFPDMEFNVEEIN